MGFATPGRSSESRAAASLPSSYTASLSLATPCPHALPARSAPVRASNRRGPRCPSCGALSSPASRQAMRAHGLVRLAWGARRPRADKRRRTSTPTPASLLRMWAVLTVLVRVPRALDIPGDDHGPSGVFSTHPSPLPLLALAHVVILLGLLGRLARDRLPVVPYSATLPAVRLAHHPCPTPTPRLTSPHSPTRRVEEAILRGETLDGMDTYLGLNGARLGPRAMAAATRTHRGAAGKKHQPLGRRPDMYEVLMGPGPRREAEKTQGLAALEVCRLLSSDSLAGLVPDLKG